MNHNKSILFYIYLIAIVFWVVFMTWLSHQNGMQTYETSSGLAEKQMNLFHLDMDIEVLNNMLRKAAHIVVFAVLTILLLLTIRTGKLPLWIAAFPFIWSLIDELTKPFIQGRHFAWYDVGLNEAGCLIGAAVAGLLWLFFGRSS